MIGENQVPERFKAVIDQQLEIYGQSRSITNRNTIPPTPQIPIEDQRLWLKIPDVICVYVDMKSSTRLSASHHEKGTAGAYQLFTGTAVRLFDAFDAPYIDVRGDGAFALFNSDQPYRAVAAAITFKTFAHEIFYPTIKNITGVDVGSHIGIDQKTVLVKKIGLKRYEDRSDRQNEVWAGKPINMAAKLASVSFHNEILVSDRFFQNIDNDLIRLSCGCPGGVSAPLWSEVRCDEDDRFDFDTAYKITSNWCKEHGREYCDHILRLDA